MIARFDDYPMGVTPPLDNYQKRFAEVLDPFEKGRVPYVLAVVPALIKRSDIEFLKSLSYAEIALHGFHHNHYIWSGYERDEFRGKDVEEIKNILLKGLELLKDFQIKTFISPFNTVRTNLIDALQDIEQITDIGIGPDTELDAGRLRVWSPRGKFYGKASGIWQKMDDFTLNDHVVFHITWEAAEREKLQNRWKMPFIVKRIREVHKIQ